MLRLMGEFEELLSKWSLDGGEVTLYPCFYWKFILFALPDGAVALMLSPRLSARIDVAGAAWA